MINLLDGKIVFVKAVTQEMLNWLEESDIKYHVTPHFTRWKYSGPKIETMRPNLGPILKIKGGPDDDLDFRQTGDDILFDKEEDKMHFQLRWAEYIKQGDDPFEF